MTDYQFQCANGHWSRTSDINYRVCTARAQSAERGVYGPECGADIERVTMEIEDFGVLAIRFTALTGAIRQARNLVDPIGDHNAQVAYAVLSEALAAVAETP